MTESLPEDTKGKGLEWPLGIAAGLLVMIVVNMCFIYVAVSGADSVDPSYIHGER